MKRKVSKILTGLTALVLLISLKALPVSAVEYIIEEEPVTGDIECYPLENENVEILKDYTEETFTVSLTGDEISLYADDGIQTFDAGNEAARDSALYHGSVSGYLSKSGDYELYSANLSAGDYLQARLTVPNNTSINYALVLYDSSLNVIKMSHYIPYLNDGATLEESIGYLATSNELVYMGIFSLVGGSETEAYTLDFSILTDFPSLSDNGEPNENVEEVAVLNLGRAGADVYGMINSPVDNDWYSFTVLDSPDYNKMRVTLNQTSSVNGCRMEVYRNLTDDYFAMQLVAKGTGEGELSLPAGKYYVRVRSTNTFSDFNPGDLPGYGLSVVPVSRVDGIKITDYTGLNGFKDAPYPEGKSYCLRNTSDNKINITGLAYYQEGATNITGAANVRLKVTVVNTSWEELGEPDFATTYKVVTTGDNGYFQTVIGLSSAVGSRYYRGDSYDYMKVEAGCLYNPSKKTDGFFYLLESPINIY